MAGEIKFVAFLTATLVFVGCLFVTIYPEWIRNSTVSSLQYLSSQNVYQGIWLRCSSSIPGTYFCDNYDANLLTVSLDIQVSRALMCVSTLLSLVGLLLSVLSLECTTLVTPGTRSKNKVGIGSGVCCLLAADLQVQRALMIAAVIVSLFGLVIGMISLRCSTIIDNDAKSKPIIGIVTGCCFLLAGMACGGAVSWFAWRVTNEYYNPLYQSREFKYEFGACLYVGWVTMILGACVMTATIWFGVELQKQFYNPEYKHASFKYEYGSCLYIGWIVSGISLISSLVLIIGSFRDLKREKHDTYVTTTAAYQPPSYGVVSVEVDIRFF